MSYTPTTWTTGDTITATKLNKMEQGIASAGGGYDFVITGDYENSDWDNVTLASGSYSDLVTMLQNDTIPSGILYFNYDDAVRIGTLAVIKDLSADDIISCGFVIFTPWDSRVDVAFFVINSDGSVDPD